MRSTNSNAAKLPATSEPTRADVFRLAAATGLDPRTARKALVEGVGSIRAVADRERVVAAIPTLGLSLPSSR
jgi:hypothetical protein